MCLCSIDYRHYYYYLHRLVLPVASCTAAREDDRQMPINRQISVVPPVVDGHRRDVYNKPNIYFITKALFLYDYNQNNFTREQKRQYRHT
jgi:hypothetical protein